MYELDEPQKNDDRGREKVRVKISGHDACPSCGEMVKRGVVLCVNCGYNFKQGAVTQIAYDAGNRETAIPTQAGANQAGGVFKTHIPPARKVRDDTAITFKADWTEPGMITAVSLVVIFGAMLIQGDPDSSALAGYAFSQGVTGHLMSGLMMGLELMLLALISLPLMFFAIFTVNAIFGVSLGTMSALPLKLLSLSLAGIAAACCFEAIFAMILLLFPNADGLLVILGVVYYPVEILIVLSLFCAIADRYFEMDYISGTLFYLIGLVIPLLLVMIIAGVMAAERFSQIAS